MRSALKSGLRFAVLAVLAVLAGFSILHGALAQDAQKALEEARFKHLASELRCLVCQNQTLFDSTSALAGDLREQVKIQIAEGKSDDEIRTFMVDRYGDFILYKPPVKPTTWLLWGVPFVLLVFGLILLLRMARRASHSKAGDAVPTERLNEARAWLDSKSTDQSN